MLLTNKAFTAYSEVEQVYSGVALCLDESGFNDMIPKEYLEGVKKLEVVKSGKFHFGLKEASQLRPFENDFNPYISNYSFRQSLKKVVRDDVKVRWLLDEVETDNGGEIVRLILKADISGEVAFQQLIKDSQGWSESTKHQIFTNYLGNGQFEVSYDHLENYDYNTEEE